MATAQTALILLVGVGWLGLEVTGPLWLAVVVALANAMLGMAMGLFLSAFAHTEFQAIQFMPAFLLPQWTLRRAHFVAAFSYFSHVRNVECRFLPLPAPRPDFLRHG